MICSHCDAEMPEISSFCPGCGRMVELGSEKDLVPSCAAKSREALLAALAYVAVIPAIVFLTIPLFRRNSFLGFHSWQSVFFTLAGVLLALVMRGLFLVLSLLPVVGYLFAWLSLGVVLIAFMVIWSVLVVKAALGEVFMLPWIGPMAAQLVQ